MGASTNATTLVHARRDACITHRLQTGKVGKEQAEQLQHTHTCIGQHSAHWAAIQTSLGNSNPQQPPETSPLSVPSQGTRISVPVKGEVNELREGVRDSERETVTLTTLPLTEVQHCPLFKAPKVNYST